MQPRRFWRWPVRHASAGACPIDARNHRAQNEYLDGKLPLPGVQPRWTRWHAVAKAREAARRWCTFSIRAGRRPVRIEARGGAIIGRRRPRGGEAIVASRSPTPSRRPTSIQHSKSWDAHRSSSPGS